MPVSNVLYYSDDIHGPSSARPLISSGVNVYLAAITPQGKEQIENGPIRNAALLNSVGIAAFAEILKSNQIIDTVVIYDSCIQNNDPLYKELSVAKDIDPEGFADEFFSGIVLGCRSDDPEIGRQAQDVLAGELESSRNQIIQDLTTKKSIGQYYDFKSTTANNSVELTRLLKASNVGRALSVVVIGAYEDRVSEFQDAGVDEVITLNRMAGSSFDLKNELDTLRARREHDR